MRNLASSYHTITPLLPFSRRGTVPSNRATFARSRLSLLDSRRVLDETEGVGRRVVGDLESQRESLLRSQAHVRDTEGAAVKARRMLRSLSRKEFRHRLLLYLVILILSGAIVLVLYLKIRRRLK